MKPETRFRINKVAPFLKKLKNCAIFPIQQVSINGDPDFILCVRGFFIALELKASSKESPRTLQKFKLDSVINAGGIAFVANPQNWEDVKKDLLVLDQGG